MNNKEETITGGKIETAQLKPEKTELRLLVIYVIFSDKSGKAVVIN